MNKTYTLLIGLLIVSCWAADCPVDASKQQKMVSGIKLLMQIRLA